MSTQENRARIQEYIETWNKGDMDTLFSFWSPDIVHHTRLASHSYEETKQIVLAFVKQFPDMRFEIADIICEDDKVVTRLRWHGTQNGNYMGANGSGSPISCNVIGVARLEDGQIVEHWGVTDELHMFAQMGLVPEELLHAMA